MRYLGSKIKLLEAIQRVISKYKIEGESFADLFSGTGCVGDFFKDKYTIISNDFLYYSSVLSKSKLLFSSVPTFSRFRKKYKQDIFVWLNNLQFVPDSTYFIYNNYTPHGDRMFFTEENGIQIDGIRQSIEQLKKNDIISESEYTFLIASLLESVTRFSNTSGTYEAFFKFWDPRAVNKFVIEPLLMNETESLKGFLAYSEDTNQLVRKISGDIAYIDPPYTVTQYVSAYHLLETLAKYDSPKITGVGGKRGRGDKNSLYARRNDAKAQFEDLFRQIQFKHIIISYSNQGLVPIDELIELARKFAVNHEVKIENYDYKEYQNHRSSNKRNGKGLNEVIIYFEKDLSINKSPLNYSGSKDTMVGIITKELPPQMSTFVDVLGGAFNVGANIIATDRVVYNEINNHIYSIIKWLMDTDKQSIIESVEKCIYDYKLGKALETPYKELREHYNLYSSPVELFVLHMYAFQNMIRFNKNQKFNTPIGVAGYSDDMRERILHFKAKCENIVFSNLDYINIDWDSYPNDTVFYFDPPYYITSAAYNDGKRGGKGWGINEELELLNILSMLDSKGYKFILSNVIEHKGKKHDILLNWVKEHRFNVINAGVSGWRYAKNEVIIKNYGGSL
ncbi:MAG: Dam family site-specific DNA-(adenine-N6)-methyltransferase [Ruminococcus sp.]|nr:Dam family site-specific DNA-(adenine-N6)-methyltransferase [Ruminococcus sp.]